MKLLFSKNNQNEIVVKFQNGTIVDDFSYTAMIKELINNNTFEDSDFGDLTVEERTKIEGMLQKITAIFKAK